MTIPNMRSWSTPGIAGLSAPTMFRLFLCWGCLDLFFRWYFLDFTMVKTMSFTTVWEISFVFFLAWNKQHPGLVNVGPIQSFPKRSVFLVAGNVRWGARSSHWWLRMGDSGLSKDNKSRKTCHFFPAALKMGRRDVGKFQFHCVLTRRTFQELPLPRLLAAHIRSGALSREAAVSITELTQASRNFMKLEPSPWRIPGSNSRKKQEAVFFQDVIKTLKRNCQVSTSSMQSTAWKSMILLMADILHHLGSI